MFCSAHGDNDYDYDDDYDCRTLAINAANGGADARLQLVPGPRDRQQWRHFSKSLEGVSVYVTCCSCSGRPNTVSKIRFTGKKIEIINPRGVRRLPSFPPSKWRPWPTVTPGGSKHTGCSSHDDRPTDRPSVKAISRVSDLPATSSGYCFPFSRRGDGAVQFPELHCHYRYVVDARAWPCPRWWTAIGYRAGVRVTSAASSCQQINFCSSARTVHAFVWLRGDARSSSSARQQHGLVPSSYSLSKYQK